MRRRLLLVGFVPLFVLALMAPTAAKDRPSDAARDYLQRKLTPAPEEFDAGNAGATMSKQKIIRYRCASSGNPAISVDMSCNDPNPDFGQDFGPDNEIAIAVDPADANHLLAGSNDYFYRFNNSTGARQAIVLTGFFTSFDGGATWIDGQIPVQSGNGAGDPAPAFQGRDGVALMAQLENAGGQGGCCVSQGDVSVARSLDGGITWEDKPVTVFKGKGAGIGPANKAIFWDKEYIAVNNFPGTPGYGRIVVTATKFVNGLHGSYASSAIWLSYSDDGGATWTDPMEISGTNPDICTFQTTGSDDGTCDEDQFSQPVFAPNGDLHVKFHNFQHEDAWEIEFDFDSTIMNVTAPATDGVPEFTDPVPVADLEDGGSDMPFTVIGRQSPWGHQIRWNAFGSIAVDPANSLHLVNVFADRGTANPNATEGCYFDFFVPPDYDPCDSGPGSDTNVYISSSIDGGTTWSPRTLVDDAGGAHQWFPWLEFLPDGRMAIAWDEDTVPPGPGDIPANDEFNHVLWVDGSKQVLMPNVAEGRAPVERVDISLTHWSGQYVPEDFWPRVCGPAGYSDPPVTDAAGKDCNVFHGDYTGLAIGSDGSINVVWTGLNALATSPQTDFYTGEPHDGYRQDAMFARRVVP